MWQLKPFVVSGDLRTRYGPKINLFLWNIFSPLCSFAKHKFIVLYTYKL